MNRKLNKYPTGTNEYYEYEAKLEGFKTVVEWAAWHYNNDPICRYCGTTKGFAPGTGDCDCSGEPGIPTFIPNPNAQPGSFPKKKQTEIN